MNKKEVLELKRRFKKEDCTITRMCGCYVDGDKNRVLKLNEVFLNLEDEEFYKYLEIASKVLSGTLGNNLIEHTFPQEEFQSGGKQQFFMGLRQCCLNNEAMMDRFYDLVIDNYSYTGNYLILVFHDVYDVMTKTTDNQKLDESEEMFEYLLCAICPVNLSKPGLGYLQEDNRIGSRIRDWVVGMPETGFLFPAFNERSTDTTSLLCYHKNPKAPHVEFVEGMLSCTSKRTATEKKQAFETIVKKAFGGDETASREAFCDIQQGIREISQNHVSVDDNENSTLLLTSGAITKIMEEKGVPETAAAIIEESFQTEFADEAPALSHILDEKAADAAEKNMEERQLKQKVEHLEQQLEDTRLFKGITDNEDTKEETPSDYVKTYDVILRVKPEKASQIKSQVLDGKKCLVIPMEEHEHAAINGVGTTV